MGVAENEIHRENAREANQQEHSHCDRRKRSAHLSCCFGLVRTMGHDETTQNLQHLGYIYLRCPGSIDGTCGRVVKAVD